MKCKLMWPYIVAVAVAVGFIACKKTVNPGPGPVIPPPFDTTATGPLKNGASFYVGLAIDYTEYINVASYAAVVLKEVNNVTLGYHQKHGAIVKNDGSFDFGRTDEMVNKASAAGLWVFGHTLTWHQNQNGDYLRSLATVAGSTDAFTGQNGDFEQGSTTSFAPHWARLVGGTAVATYEVETSSVPQGSRASKVNVTTQTLLEQQAEMYRFVLQSYYSKVPAAQRYGVTVWGVTDNYSWIVLTLGREDFPLLFDQGYRKKAAYVGLWKGLKQQ